MIGAAHVTQAAEQRQRVAEAQAFAEARLGRPLTEAQLAAFARGVLAANQRPVVIDQEGTVLIAVACPPIKDLAERGAITLAPPPPPRRWPRVAAVAVIVVAAGTIVGCAIGWFLGTLSTLIGAAL